ncbi:hypothetical protein JCM6882_005092 [Rhodosporidiobolus microsporus]
MGRWQNEQASWGRPYERHEQAGSAQYQQNWRGAGPEEHWQEQNQYGGQQTATTPAYYPQPPPFAHPPAFYPPSFSPFNPYAAPPAYHGDPSASSSSPSPWMPNPAVPALHPSPPAFSPFPPSQPLYGWGSNGGGESHRGGWGGSDSSHRGEWGAGANGSWDGARGYEDRQRVSGRDWGGGDSRWSTGNYREGYRNQTWRRDDGHATSSSSAPYDPSLPSFSREPHPHRPRSPSRRPSSRSRSPSRDPYPSSRPPLGPPSNAPTAPRAQSDQGYTNAPSYGPNGEYIPPQRRQKRDKRVGPVPEPTKTYLAATQVPSTTHEGETVDAGGAAAVAAGGPEPPLLILDLNHTLLCRAKRTSWGSRQPLVRPYLSTFLEYICSSSSLDPASSTATSASSSPSPSPAERRRPRFLPVVYSSARAPNVLSMLAALSLIPRSRLPSSATSSAFSYLPFGPPPYVPAPEEGDVLAMVFTREMMGLSKADYAGDVETTKDVGKVWEEMGWGGLRDWRLEERRSREQAAAELDREASGAGAGERNPDEVDLGEDLSEGDGDGEGQGETLSQDPSAGAKKPRKTPNKKAKARMERLRDELGARRTLLLDDEASKAAQQPHNHLPIRPFIVLPNEFPPPVLGPASSITALPHSASPSRPPSPPRFQPPPLAALQLAASHPAADDPHLLGTIYLLELLRCETNISHALRGGLFTRVREEVRSTLAGEDSKDVSERDVDEELARRGRAVCEKLGVEVRREWDECWRDKVLEREGRAPATAS